MNEEAVIAQFTPKLHIPKQSVPAVRRQRLTDLLHRNLDKSVQTVCAPAGYGKTTLLADFCSDLDIPVCWYSLDSSDRDVEWFAKGLVASLRVHFPQFGGSIDGLRLANERGSNVAARLAEWLASEISIGITDYFLLVLEDYHVVAGTDVDLLIARLLERAPENCHLVISSRDNIALPAVSTRLVRGQAFALTVSDMAFTPGETKELLEHQGGSAISESDLERLVLESEGWIVGMLLLFQGRLGGRTSAGLSRQDVFSYLASEVYELLPAELQTFLLKSSVLDQVYPEFCDGLLRIRNSQKLLQETQRRNLFVSTVEMPKPCYRFHPLFRDFLRRRLDDADPEESRRLHVRAGSMFREEQLWPEAIDHFTAAGRYSQSRDILTSVGQQLLDSGKWAMVARCIDSLPARYRLSDAETMLLRAQCDIHAGKIDEAANALTAIIAAKGRARSWQHEARALSWRSATHRLAGNLEAALADVRAAISILEQNRGASDLLGDGYRRLGIILHEQGHLAGAVRQFRRALKHFSSTFALEQSASVHNSLGIVYRELGRLTEAGMHLELARQGWERTGNKGSLAAVMNNLGLVYQCQGDYEHALKTFRAGLQDARESGYRRMEACILISTADLLRDVGLYEDALSMYSEGLKVAEEVMEMYYVVCATAGMGEVRRILGEHEKATILLKQAVSLAESNGRQYEAAVFSARLGVIEYQKGECDQAALMLRAAYSRVRKMGDKEALARICLHLAQVEFLLRHYKEAKARLTETSRLADEIGYDAFLAVEGREVPLLLQYGASQGIGAGRFVRALEGIAGNVSEVPKSLPEIRLNRRDGSKLGVEVYAFGQARVLVNGREVPDSEWRSARAAEMFFYLLSSDKPKTREQIAVDLWPDLSPAKSTSNFHISLYRARRALFPGVIVLQNGRYRIPREARIWFDVAEFLKSVNRTRAPSNTGEAASDLQRAVDLYTGPFLPDVYSEWADDLRQELQNKYVKALRGLAKGLWERGDLQKAMGVLEQAAIVAPYNDELLSDMESWASSRQAVPLLNEFRKRLELLNR